MTNIIEVKAKVGKQLFYNQESMFGGYSFYLTEASEEINVDKKWGNFVVTGNCPMLIKDKEYEFTMQATWSKKYGDGYSFVDVKERKLTTVQDQQEYLKQIISTRDANNLISAYPNVMIVDYIKQDKIDTNKVKGIKATKLKKIKDKLSMYENLQVALVELKDLGISMNALQKLVNHFGSQDSLINNVKANIYCLIEIDMFGFDKVDTYAMNRGDNPNSPYRIKACFEHLLKDEGNDGHSWVSIDEMISKAETKLKIDTVHIVNVMNEIMEDKKGKFYTDNERIALRKYYHYESGIKSHLDRLVKNYQPQTEYISIDELEKELNIEFTDEQKEAILNAQKSGVFILNGKAGSGKTTVLKAIIDSHNTTNYMACALSGKATKVLYSKGIKSMTIHRMLGVANEGRFHYNEEDKLPYDIIVVDESSMVNSQLFYSILQAVEDGSKIIIVGDNEQLPAIGVGAVFNDLLQTNFYPNKELTKVHRQALKSGILSSANQIREGEQINKRYDYSPQVYGELKDMVLYPMKDREDIFSTILQIAKGYYEKYKNTWLYDFQIITALKQRGENSVKNLNKELQGVFNNLELDYLERNGYQFRQYDKVIHSGNNYSALVVTDLKTYHQYKELDADEIEELMEKNVDDFIPFTNQSVFNGTIGKIEYIDFDKKEALIQFEDLNGLVVYTQQELNMIELAYAITIHRSQGMGIKNVLVTFDYVAYKLLSRQMVYTSFTRASEKLVVICEQGALHKAIETDSGLSRNTFLKDMIMKGVK